VEGRKVEAHNLGFYFAASAVAAGGAHFLAVVEGFVAAARASDVGFSFPPFPV